MADRPFLEVDSVPRVAGDVNKAVHFKDRSGVRGAAER